METQGNYATQVPEEQVETKLETQSSPKLSHSILDITVKGTSFVVLVLLIVGIAVDKLNTGSQTGQIWWDGEIFYGTIDAECKWKESGMKVHGSSDWVWITYEDACDGGIHDGEKILPDEDACSTQHAGQVWLAFGILGIVAQAVAIGSMIASVVVHTSDKSIIAKEAILRLAALGVACAFVLIQWSVWKAKGCSDNTSDFDMGVSMVLIIIAWALNVVATGMQAVNTLQVLHDTSSGSPAKQADLEDGSNIRS